MANQLPNIPDSIKADHLPSLFKSYSKLDASEPSSWIVWSDDGSKAPVSHIRAICHADMREDEGFDHLITAVPKSDAVSIAYQRMLIHGPFKGLSDLITLERLDDRYFIHCSNLNWWPSNVLFNYCIATRVPIEHKNLLPRWAATVEEGYDPTLAFLLSYSTGGKEHVNFREYPMLGHFWFAPSSDWTRILSGDFTAMHKTYKTNPGAVRPCDTIWGASDAWEKLRKLGPVEISEYFGLPIQKVVVPPQPVKKKTKHDALIEMIQQQQAAADLQPPGGEWHPNQIQPPQWLQANPAAEMVVGGGEPGIMPPAQNFVFNGDNWGAAPHPQPQPEILDDDDNDFDDHFDDFEEDPDF